MYYLIYISKANELMMEPILIQLLKDSRNWNQAHELTGMLLYIEGNFLKFKGARFIQVLEGSALAVNEIFEKITNDQRHFNIIVLNKGSIDKRNFDQWTMGFKSMQLEDYEKHPGHFELDERFLDIMQLQKINPALDFLRSFYSLHFLSE